MVTTNGIWDNSADANGGGIAVINGGTVNLFGFQSCQREDCSGSNLDPVSITYNSAGNLGGAIYAVGSSTKVNVFNGLIWYNDSNQGGAYSIGDQAALKTGTLTVDPISGNKVPCWNSSNNLCNEISYNSTNDSEFIQSWGGGLYLFGGSLTEISSTYINMNKAKNGLGAVLFASDSTGIIKNSLVVQNGNSTDTSLIHSTTSHLDVVYTTMADNHFMGSIFNFDSENIPPGYSSELNVLSSIIDEQNGVSNNVLNHSPHIDSVLTFDCVIAHEIDSLTEVDYSFQVIAADPQFIDSLNDNYHINAQTSPAVDYCDNTMTTSVTHDTDNELRGWDDPNVTNNTGAYDIGFDETYDNDIIFSDGF